MSFCGKIYRKITKKIDVFGTPPELSIAGDQKYATSSGGVISVLLALLIMYFLVSSMNVMLQYQSPVTTTTQSFSDKPGPLNLTSPDFTFAIGVAIDGNFIDVNQGSFFSYNITQTVCPPSITEDCVTVDMGSQPCPAEFYANYPQIGNYTKGFVCPVNTSFYLTGQPLGDFYDGYVSSYITVVLTQCNETLFPNTTCLNQSDINAAFGNPSLGAYVFFTSTFVNLTNHTSPIQTVIGYTGGSISPEYLDVRTNQYLDGVSITTSDSWYSSANWTEHSFTVNTKAQETQLDNPSPENSYFLVKFRRSQNANVYTRQYTRIGDVFSSVGGFARAIVAVMTILVGGYAALKYRIYFANQIYDYKRKFEIFGKQDFHPPEDTITKRGSILIGEYLIHEINPKVKRNEKANAFASDHYKNLFLPCLYRKTDKGKQLAQVDKRVSEDADIIKIVKSLKRFEKLKQVILNDDQKLLFESAQDTFYEEPPSTYFLEGNLYEQGFDENEPLYQSLEFKKLERMGDLYQAYVTVFKLNQKTESSKALYKMLDEELIRFMEDIYQHVGANFDRLPDYFINSIRMFVSYKKEKKNK